MRMMGNNNTLPLLVMAFALVSSSAFAQMSPQMSFPTQKRHEPLTPEQQKYQKEFDENYKAASKKIPDQNPNDPWANIRPAPAVPSNKKQP